MPLVIDRPTYAVVVNEDSEGNLWTGLLIQSSSVSMTVFLCDGLNYRQVANQMHENIMEAGKEMTRPRIIAAKGSLNSNGKAH